MKKHDITVLLPISYIQPVYVYNKGFHFADFFPCIKLKTIYNFLCTSTSYRHLLFSLTLPVF